MRTTTTFLQVGFGDARDHAVYAKLLAELGPGRVAMALLADNALLSRLPGVRRVRDLRGAIELVDCRRPEIVLMWSPELLLDPRRASFDAPGRLVLGPTAAAAELEGSKRSCKTLLDEYGIATPAWIACSDLAAAQRELEARWGAGERWIVKADRYLSDAALRTMLPADLAEAKACAARLFAVAPSLRGEQVLLERFVAGEELSLHVLLDGQGAVVAPPVADYKCLLDKDRGPNTHGMGAISASGDALWKQLELRSRIVDPLLHMLEREGLEYRGILYVGLLCGPDGPQVLEINVRPGNPEWQTLLARLRRPLGEVLTAMRDGTLGEQSPFDQAAASGSLFVTHPDYPRRHDPSDATLDLPCDLAAGVTVLGEGVRKRGDRLVLGQRRSICVVARGDDVASVRRKLYTTAADITVAGAHLRTDIGLLRPLATGTATTQPEAT